MSAHDHDGHHSHHSHHDHRFPGSPDALRAPQRMALLEVSHVVDLCLEGGSVTSVLDVGTGSGIFAEEFVKRGLHLTGIDVNPDMIVAARQYAPLGQFQEAPADALPFADGSFDLVFLAHVLHEVSNPVRALEEARRVARERVVVLEWPYRSEEFGPPLEHRLRDEDIVTFAGDAGLGQSERLALAHMTLYRFSV
jgi:SAM-dependent methyltransferase